MKNITGIKRLPGKTTARLRRLALEDLDRALGVVAQYEVRAGQLYFVQPTGNLDEKNTNDIMNLLSNLNNQGLTIIMVTHDLTLARSISKKVLRLHYGQIVDQEDGAK